MSFLIKNRKQNKNFGTVVSTVCLSLILKNLSNFITQFLFYSIIKPKLRETISYPTFAISMALAENSCRYSDFSHVDNGPLFKSRTFGEIHRNWSLVDLSGIQFYVKPTYPDRAECVYVRNGNATLDVIYWRWTNSCAFLLVALYVLASINQRQNELAFCHWWMFSARHCVPIRELSVTEQLRINVKLCLHCAIWEHYVNKSFNTKASSVTNIQIIDME